MPAVLVGIVSDSGDSATSPSDFITVQSNGTTFQSSKSNKVLWTTDITGGQSGGCESQCPGRKAPWGWRAWVRRLACWAAGGDAGHRPQATTRYPSADGAWHMVTLTTEAKAGEKGYSMYLDGGFIGSTARAAASGGSNNTNVRAGPACMRVGIPSRRRRSGGQSWRPGAARYVGAACTCISPCHVWSATGPPPPPPSFPGAAQIPGGNPLSMSKPIYLCSSIDGDVTNWFSGYISNLALFSEARGSGTPQPRAGHTLEGKDLPETCGLRRADRCQSSRRSRLRSLSPPPSHTRSP